jgi:hypothetical protein
LWLRRRPDQSIVKVPVGDSPQRGPDDARVTVVEFADFECSFCRAEQPVLTDIEAIYGGDLRLVFKYFPLPMGASFMEMSMGTGTACSSPTNSTRRSPAGPSSCPAAASSRPRTVR